MDIFQKMRRFFIGTITSTKLETKAEKEGAQQSGEEAEKRRAVQEAEGQKPEAKPAASSSSPQADSSGTEEKRKPSKHRKRPRWSVESFIVPEEEGKSRFHDFPVPVQVMHAIADLNFRYCTPIQEKSLPHTLSGKDLVGKANTGTGKTAVFLITIISALLRSKRQGKSQARALILAPTRELVIQIGKDARALAKYTPLAVRTVFGGADYQKQAELLREKPCDIVIATPGRLLDFLGKNIIQLGRTEIIVLDEADRMLDMGFIPDVRRIMGRLPAKEKRQTLLFSATITGDVRRLAGQWCVSPAEIDAEPEQAAESVAQTVYLASSDEKYRILYNLITRAEPERGRIIIFTNMKGEGRRLAERLTANGINCLLLTGDVPQKKRTSRLERFRKGEVRVLVATDVAGRGIHIEGIELVVNYTLPYEPEDYIHRIGRTGRAGAAGRAVSFACEEGSFYLPAIEELLETKIDCVMPEEELLQAVPPTPQKSAAGKRGQSAGKKGRGRRPRRQRGYQKNKKTEKEQKNGAKS